MSQDPQRIVSKLLVLDEGIDRHEDLRRFFEQHDLVALKAQPYNVMGILRSNLDFGAIMLHEHYGGQHAGIGFAREIHQLRPELPILLRRDGEAGGADLSDLGEAASHLFASTYNAHDLDGLHEAVQRHIFNCYYPTSFVRGVAEITSRMLDSQFNGVDIAFDTPCLVRDRLIHGELLSLIPIESNWCRGYLMLQAAESEVIDFLKHGKTWLELEQVDFRDCNNVLAEATNLIWGGFKTRYVTEDLPTVHLTQVPIIVNHLHRYISFGSQDPQLSIRYTLRDTTPGSKLKLDIHQRLIFNLHWRPDELTELDASVGKLLAAGQVEYF
jgi:Chemotaxis phosphatase CheX